MLATAKLQGGYVREWPMSGSALIGVGGSAALAVVPLELKARYGGRTAVSIGGFVALRPQHRMSRAPSLLAESAAPVRAEDHTVR